MFLFLFLHFHSCSSFFPVPLFHLFYLFFLPFSGRRHKMTHKGWRVVKPQHNQFYHISELILPHFMIILILYINLLNLSWIKKMSNYEEWSFKIWSGRLNILDLHFNSLYHFINTAEQGLVFVYHGGKTFPFEDGTMKCGNSFIRPCPRYTVRIINVYLFKI